MASPPAKCRNCGRIVPAKGYDIGAGATGISFTGNTFSPCPICGGTCDVLDGVYEGGEDAVKLLTAPQATIDALLQAGLLVRQALAAGKSEEEALASAATALPALEKLKGFARSALGKTILTVLGLVAENRLGHLLDEFFDGPQQQITPAVAEAIVKRALEEQEAKRQEAAARAGIREVRPVEAPPLRMSPHLTVPPPEVSKSVAKMHRDLVARYRQQESGQFRNEGKQ